MRDLLVEIRDPDLQRRGQIDARDLNGASFIRRRRSLGGWALQLPASVPACQLLRQTGWGLIATLDGDVFLSGPTQRAEFKASAADPAGTWTISGYDDSRILGDLLAWPSPATSDLSAQAGTAGSGYDQRSGPAETLMRAYVLANAGALAPGDRRVALLDVATDQARGATVAGSARFDALGDILNGLATVGGDLGYRVRQQGARLVFEVTVPRDLSALIRFDLDNGTLDDLTYSYEAPTLTRAVVGGEGEAAARTLVPRWTADSLAAEADWARTIWRFLDERGTASLAELEQAGDKALIDGGATKVGLTISPVDTDLVQFGRDYLDGDTVTVVVGDVEIADVITETTLTIGPDGLSMKATVGDSNAAVSPLTDPLLRALRDTRDQARRLGRLERR